MAKPHHLLWVFSTFATGGPQIRFCQLVKLLGDEYRHTVIAMDGNYDTLARAEKLGDVKHHPITIYKSSGISFKNIQSFKAAVKTLEPDLLLTNNWGAIEWFFANWRMHLPHIHIEDGFGPNERPDKQLTRRIIMRRIAFFRYRTAYIAPSKVLERVFHTTWKVKHKDIHYIPNGVDCKLFDVPRNPSKMNSDNSPVVIGSLGALRPEKRFDRLIDAFAAIAPDTNTHLRIIGDGPEMNWLQNYAATSGFSDRIEFTGATNEPEKALSELDIYAISSDTEQMPISMVEAMASGLAIVATDVGDIKDMLPKVSKPYVIQGSDGLSGCLHQLISNSDERHRIGKANQEKADSDYQEEFMAEQYHLLFQHMISSANGKA